MSESTRIAVAQNEKMMTGLLILHFQLCSRDSLRLLIKLVYQTVVNILNCLYALIKIVKVGHLIVLIILGPYAQTLALILRLMSLVISTTTFSLFCWVTKSAMARIR